MKSLLLLTLVAVFGIDVELKLQSENAKLQATNRKLRKTLQELAVGEETSVGRGTYEWSDQYGCHYTKTSCGFSSKCPEGCKLKTVEFFPNCYMGMSQKVCCCDSGDFGSSIGVVPPQDRGTVDQRPGSAAFWEQRDIIVDGKSTDCGGYTSCGWACDWNDDCNLDTRGCYQTEHEYNPHEILGGQNYNLGDQYKWMYLCAYLQDSNNWKNSMGYIGCYISNPSAWWTKLQFSEPITPQQCKRKCKDSHYFALGGRSQYTGGKTICACGREHPQSYGHPAAGGDKLCHYGLGNIDGSGDVMYALYSHHPAYEYGHESGFRYDGQWREHVTSYWEPCKEDLSKGVRCFDQNTNKAVKEYTGPLPSEM